MSAISRANCRKLLDSGKITEHDGEMFCGSCYSKNFGPKGYGFGGGSGTLSMDDGKGYQSNKTHVDHQAMAYVAPKRTVSPPNGNENKAANSNGTTNGVNGAAKTAKKFPKWGGAEVCPRCDRSVFIAELMRGAGHAWHKSCFTCNTCNKRIDSSNLCEREAEIYCRSCYGKSFGPKGFGYGIGMTLEGTSPKIASTLS